MFVPSCRIRSDHALLKPTDQTKATVEGDRAPLVARGKRWFFVRAPWPGGLVLWLGMNALFLTRNHADLRGRFLFGWELVFLLLSVFFGLVDSLILWNRIKRLASSE